MRLLTRQRELLLHDLHEALQRIRVYLVRCLIDELLEELLLLRAHVLLQLVEAVEELGELRGEALVILLLLLYEGCTARGQLGGPFAQLSLAPRLSRPWPWFEVQGRWHVVYLYGRRIYYRQAMLYDVS